MSMQKQYTYRNVDFTIIVTMNTKIEKCINGKRWHTILAKTIDQGGDGYLDSMNVLDQKLEYGIVESVQLLQNWIDVKLDGEKPEDHRLTNLGFENC